MDYTKLPKQTLKDTVSMMESHDYKERFRAEYYQLRIRISKLSKLISDYGFGKLDFEPACSMKLLMNQHNAMIEYEKYLRERSFVEHIDIDFGEDGEE